MFKTLAALFKSDNKVEEAEEPVVPVVETEEDEEPTPPEEDEQPEGEPQATVSVERYNALLAAEAELGQFGATKVARVAFMAEVKQLHAWYNNVKAVGIKGAVADANQEQKGKAKAVSSVTKEAMEMEAKRK